ncbi:MAG: 30S ribosomal protein S8 [Planctomyces sp.]|nr:30S ribosomal protein S8 [Planctomyces sp.]MBA4119409.1 30S ribosomal protein S8 [Isosphaera sp.]
MAFNDMVSDMVARIRNALANKAKTVEVRNNRVCRGIAQVLRDEGYIESFEHVADPRVPAAASPQPAGGSLKLKLKYGPRGERVLTSLTRLSKPGRRVYSTVEDLPRPLQGLGIAIVSTSKGVLSDRKCRTERVGGELLCVVE